MGPRPNSMAFGQLQKQFEEIRAERDALRAQLQNGTGHPSRSRRPPCLRPRTAAPGRDRGHSTLPARAAAECGLLRAECEKPGPRSRDEGAANGRPAGPGVPEGGAQEGAVEESPSPAWNERQRQLENEIEALRRELGQPKKELEEIRSLLATALAGQRERQDPQVSLAPEPEASPRRQPAEPWRQPDLSETRPRGFATAMPAGTGPGARTGCTGPQRRRPRPAQRQLVSCLTRRAASRRSCPAPPRRSAPGVPGLLGDRAEVLASQNRNGPSRSWAATRNSATWWRFRLQPVPIRSSRARTHRAVSSAPWTGSSW